jgi:hypothetical protein
MKVKIERVSYPHLWNSEFPLVVDQTLSICEKYDMQSMMLEKSYNELVSYRPQLNSMSVYSRKNAKIVAAGIFDSERDSLINGFVKAIKAMKYVDLPQIKPHFELLDSLLSKHKASTIALANNISETERLIMLENEINANPGIQAAIMSLNLDGLTQRLFEANKEYDKIFREYIAEKSSEQPLDVASLRRNCYKSLTQFFDAVQYCAFANEHLDYTALVNELRQLNNYYRQQLKARATRRMNGKDTMEEEPIAPPAA